MKGAFSIGDLGELGLLFRYMVFLSVSLKSWKVFWLRGRRAFRFGGLSVRVGGSRSFSAFFFSCGSYGCRDAFFGFVFSFLRCCFLWFRGLVESEKRILVFVFSRLLLEIVEVGSVLLGL